MTLMMSPDGKAARFIVTHEGNAMGPEGVDHVEAFPQAITLALNETSLAGARVYIGGAGSNNKDIKEYTASDLLIVAIAAFVLIFLIMMFLTRSLVAAFVIPGTRLLGRRSVRSLRARVAAPHRPAPSLVGIADHVHHPGGGGLRLQPPVDRPSQGGGASRVEHRSHPRARKHGCCGDIGGFGVRVHHAGDANKRSQDGSTVCIGLLLDTLVVRSFVVPCILRLLGPWFWWPTLVRPRPLRQR